jgi:hypothetical protein
VPGSSAGWSDPVVFFPDSPRNKMVKQRKKATAKRPNRPVSPDELKKIMQRKRDAEMDARAKSRVAKQSRERMKSQGR